MNIIQTDRPKLNTPKRLIQPGNSKLPSLMMFNIPASKEICGRICRGCYSYKAYRIYPNVLPAQEARYEASKLDTFVDTITEEISRVRKPFKYFRVHASAGEFYSQEYVDKWYQIAVNNPKIMFYAYTKRMRKFDFKQLKSLPNFVLIDSLQYRGLNYGPLDKAPQGSFICPALPKTDIVCSVDCNYCMTKQAQVVAPYFKEH